MGVSDLREVPLTLLRKHPNIPVVFLLQLANNPSLYDLCNVHIKRQIWLSSRELFKDKVRSILIQFATQVGETDVGFEMINEACIGWCMNV